MIDHLTLTVRDYARSKEFYLAALEPLGYAVRMEFEGSCGMGPPGMPCLWLVGGEAPTSPLHLAFHSESRAPVDAFHAAALAAGAKDNGAPGLRPDYHPSYYAAFVIDPDGRNVEMVCHAAEAPAGAKARGKGKKAPAAKAAPRKTTARKQPAGKAVARRAAPASKAPPSRKVKGGVKASRKRGR